MEVNIPSKYVPPIQKQVQDKEFTIDLFDKIEKLVIGNLSDTYCRFITTNEFKKYSLKLQLEKELKDQ